MIHTDTPLNETLYRTYKSRALDREAFEHDDGVFFATLLVLSLSLTLSHLIVFKLRCIYGHTIIPFPTALVVIFTILSTLLCYYVRDNCVPNQVQS